MNRKGFTLIELLAVVVLLAIVGGIATYGVINTINTSKLKAEKIFVDRLSTQIESYINLYSKDLTKTDKYHSIKKCNASSCPDELTDDNSYEVTIYELKTISISDLIDAKVLIQDEIVNPRTKEKCYVTTDNNIEIKVYKDTDYVYYYYADLSKFNCHITDKIINTLPNGLEPDDFK